MCKAPLVLVVVAVLDICAYVFGVPVLALCVTLRVMCSATAEGVTHELLPIPPLPLACWGVRGVIIHTTFEHYLTVKTETFLVLCACA